LPEIKRFRKLELTSVSIRKTRKETEINASVSLGQYIGCYSNLNIKRIPYELLAPSPRKSNIRKQAILILKQVNRQEKLQRI